MRTKMLAMLLSLAAFGALTLSTCAAHAYEGPAGCDRAEPTQDGSAYSDDFDDGERAERYGEVVEATADGRAEGAKAAHQAFEDAGCLAEPSIMNNLYEVVDGMDGGSDTDSSWIDGFMAGAQFEAKAHGCPRLVYQY